MGNVISLVYNVSDQLYERYYPKSCLLRPANLASAAMALVIGSQFWSSKVHPNTDSNNLVFLFSAGANLGIQLWVSFISGMTMIRILPRHQFGAVQASLFPKFFSLTSMFSFGSLYSFLKINPVSSWKDKTLLLGSVLTSSFALNLVNLVWLNPKTIGYNQRMHRIEKDAGEGITIIGKLKQQSKVESDPEYQSVKRKFGMYHSVSLTSNALSLASTLAQFYVLASRSFFSL